MVIKSQVRSDHSKGAAGGEAGEGFPWTNGGLGSTTSRAGEGSLKNGNKKLIMVNFEVATNHPQPACGHRAQLSSRSNVDLHIGQDVVKQSRKDCDCRTNE